MNTVKRSSALPFKFGDVCYKSQCEQIDIHKNGITTVYAAIRKVNNQVCNFVAYRNTSRVTFLQGTDNKYKAESWVYVT